MIHFRSSGVGNLMTYPRTKAAKDAGELSETAKRFVEETWLFNEYGYREELKSKYVQKGNYLEEKSISLLTQVTGVWYAKNEERKTANGLTGECDLLGQDHIVDIKTSWDLKTFFNSDLSKLYEWQLRAYMELWNIPYARLAYCLLDCPDELFVSEQNRIYYKYQKWAGEGFEAIEEVNNSYIKEMDQLRSNLKIEDRIPPEKRVKVFTIERDSDKTAEMYERIEAANKYYKTLTL